MSVKLILITFDIIIIIVVIVIRFIIEVSCIIIVITVIMTIIIIIIVVIIAITVLSLLLLSLSLLSFGLVCFACTPLNGHANSCQPCANPIYVSIGHWIMIGTRAYLFSSIDICHVLLELSEAIHDAMTSAC